MAYPSQLSGDEWFHPGDMQAPRNEHPLFPDAHFFNKSDGSIHLPPNLELHPFGFEDSQAWQAMSKADAVFNARKLPEDYQLGGFDETQMQPAISEQGLYVNTQRPSIHTAPPQYRPPSRIPTRGYHTDPIPRHVQHGVSNGLSGVELQQPDSIEPDRLLVNREPVHLEALQVASLQPGNFKVPIYKATSFAPSFQDGGSESDSPASSFKSQLQNIFSIRPKQKKRARHSRRQQNSSAQIAMGRTATGHQQSREIGEAQKRSVVDGTATSFIETWLKLYPSTFFRTGNVAAMSTLTSNFSKSVEDLISQLLEIDLLGIRTKADDPAMSLVKSWVELYPTAFFEAEKLDAIAILTSLSSQTVQHLISQRLQDGLLESLHGNDSPKASEASRTIGRPELASERTESQIFTRGKTPLGGLDGRPILKQASVSLINGRVDKCQPTADVALLSRDEDKVYQCTFKCGGYFTTKGDFRRHEEELNYPQEGWVCDLEPVVLLNGIPLCAYCELQNPSIDHAPAKHQNRTPFCHQKPIGTRGKVITRKRRFIDHLKHIHPHIPYADYMKKCRFVVESRFPKWCGFCQEYHEFRNFKDRINHMACHFEEDELDMSTWRDPPTLHKNGDTDGDRDRDEDEGGGDDYDNTDEDGNEEDYNDDKTPNNQPQGKAKPSGNQDFQGSSKDLDTAPSTWALSRYVTSSVKQDEFTPTVEGKVTESLAERSLHPEYSSEAFTNDIIRLERRVSASQVTNVRGVELSWIGLSRSCGNHQLHRMGLAKFDHSFRNPAVSRSTLPIILDGPTFTNSSMTIDKLTTKNTRAIAVGPYQLAPKVWWRWRGVEIDRKTSHTEEEGFQEFSSVDRIISPTRIQDGHSNSLQRNRSRNNNLLKKALCTVSLDLPIERVQENVDVRKPNGPGPKSLLEGQLHEALIQHKHREYFVPINELDRLVTADAIRYELEVLYQDSQPSEISSTARYIQENARKVFAILVFIGKGAYIREFIKERVTDADLPLKRWKETGSASGSLPTNLCHPVYPGLNWSKRDIASFNRDQWSFIAPVFDKVGQHYELEDDCILPFIENNSGIASQTISGGYSDVWSVRIHPAHQNLYRSPKQQEPLIAVKRLKSSDPAEFKKEACILKEIAKKNHPHLTKLLVTFHINRAYHLMFPYADGNLRKYWEDHPKSSWSSGVVLWSLKQMWGLASGLEAIHNFDSSYNGYKLGAPVLGNTDDFLYGRHGDIKPENILWFKELEGTGEGGILKITDFGLGGFHGRDSRSNIDPRDVASTPTYEPPEYALQMPVSRAYDIWSLACLYLEFITWLLGGATMVERFADARMALGSDGIISDKFYTLQEEPGWTAKACVRDKVLIWMESLHSHEQCSDIMHNLLDLVRQELLVVDVKQRIPSWVLAKKLDILVKRAETDNGYLLHPTPRFSLETTRKGTDPELPTNSIIHPNPSELGSNQTSIVPPQRRSSAEINPRLDPEAISRILLRRNEYISTNSTSNETEQSRTLIAEQRLKYSQGIIKSTARPSTSCEFGAFFPSQRRLYIRHDDTTEDGNMNLRVEIEVPEGLHRTQIQLFHLRMHDLKARKFSLRRYCRDSGREVCNSSRRYEKPASERPAIQRPVSNALASFRNKPEFKRTYSGGSLKHTPREDSGYASNGDEDDDNVDSLMSSKSKSRSSISMPTNTTKLEFSNYAQVDVKCCGAKSHKRYEFEYWGSNYAWKRVCINDSAEKSFSFHLRKDSSGPAIAHIVPELHSRSQICVEEEASCWVPPCSMWICDEKVWSALTDISDVIVATGLIALVDDCIKRRFNPKPKHAWHISVPSTLLKMDFKYISPKALVNHVLCRRSWEGKDSQGYGQSPVHDIHHALPCHCHSLGTTLSVISSCT